MLKSSQVDHKLWPMFFVFSEAVLKLDGIEYAITCSRFVLLILDSLYENGNTSGQIGLIHKALILHTVEYSPCYQSDSKKIIQ